MTGRRKLRDHGATARFVSYKVDPARAHDLAEDHPAVVEGRTLFPGNVTPAMASKRLLVSGKNNPKTGDRVLKGPWKGMPIFTVTLEERATCPTDCALWRGCYGNAMQWPRRNDAYDPDFIAALAAEVITNCRVHPEGIVVRLHILGDFFSAQYVAVWAHLLGMLPGLHLFGYTARQVESADAETRRIARCVGELNRAPSRCVIRTSHAEPGHSRSIVVNEDPRQSGVIVCPAMTEKTASCATCALCWAVPALPHTIAFLRHGLKAGPRSRQRGERP